MNPVFKNYWFEDRFIFYIEIWITITFKIYLACMDYDEIFERRMLLVNCLATYVY